MMTKENSETKPSETPIAAPKSGMSRKIIIGVVVVLVVIAFMLYRSEQSRRETETRLEETAAELVQIQEGSTQQTSEALNQEVLAQVGTLMQLPTDTTSTVATITDVDRLREANEFFNQARNGNFLIITSSRAILYDREANIIVDVAPYRSAVPSDDSEESPDPSASPTTTSTPKPTATPTPEPSSTPTSTPTPAPTVGEDNSSG